MRFNKSLTMAGIALSTVCSFSAFAAPGDVFEIKGGYDHWVANTKVDDVKADDSQNQSSFYVGFEHFVPLIPNAKIRYTNAASSNLDTSFKQVDYIAYYHLLDSNLIGLDLGLNMQQFRDGKVGSQHFDTWQPALYGDVEINIPALPIAIYSTISTSNYDGTKTFDGEAGAKWIIEMGPLDLGLKAGYRIMDHTFETTQSGDTTTKQNIKLGGYYLGAELKF